MQVEFISIREMFYNLITLRFENRKEEFVNLSKYYLKNQKEIKLPMQLFEKLFNFDFHRDAKHSIKTNDVLYFKENGLRVSKVRNKYQIRIRKNK